MIPKNNSVILKLFFKESYVSVEMKGVCVCLNWILAIFVKDARVLVTVQATHRQLGRDDIDCSLTGDKESLRKLITSNCHSMIKICIMGSLRLYHCYWHWF